MTATIIAMFVVAAVALALGFWFSFESLRAWRRALADLAEAKRNGDGALDLMAKAQRHHDEAKRHHEIAQQVHQHADDILARARTTEAVGAFPVTGREVDTAPEIQHVPTSVPHNPFGNEDCWCFGTCVEDETYWARTEDERRQQRRRHLAAQANKEK